MRYHFTFHIFVPAKINGSSPEATSHHSGFLAVYIRLESMYSYTVISVSVLGLLATRLGMALS